MDKTTLKILGEINMYTNNIQNNFPELVPYLEENPSTIPITSETSSDQAFEDYLSYLKTLVKNYMKTHKVSS